GILNRMDTALLYLPALALAFWPQRSLREVAVVAAGLLPLLAWEVFAIIYYGFPFPNTAYAKLGLGIPADELARQGLYYLRNGIATDPVLAAAIVVGVLTALARQGARQRALALGVLLYLAYVVRIGGDFMSGRFLVAPLIGAVVLLARLPLGSRRLIWGTAL